MKIANNVKELIGNTPLVKINKFGNNATILAKCEFLNPSHSVKDRVAFNMIKRAMEDGKIDKNSVIIEPTSGNTGVGLAMVCAELGLKMILTMPSSMSVERQKLLKAFGAKLVLTEPKYGMQGAVDKALELAKENPNSFIPSQFDNPANPEMHKITTAVEILNDTDGKVDIFVAGFGTGGTVSGVGAVLKERNPNIKIIAVEPEKSPLITKGEAGPHAIQGIGANFIPKNLNQSIIDEFITVSNEDAMNTTKALARTEGLLVGISSGANVYAAKTIAERKENQGKTIVTVLCDTGERYLSTTVFDD
ncbi:cysteine synthase A [Campylobacter hyointestinalis subsp. hyointestinalis]|uniref:Cysteine synthase n=1 Tax=Campylobacter hyointestinalis subsp. hyointestinalis TaxID=91352 RepID=A0A9W5EQY9_CAMHY|nr:cysteine synthase A [Campylobacter hyointestinalis]TWO18881.1 cysteine synthase A [Campylobacter hyointestinalis]CUU71968.1 cysteine synthase A [Campylobacter hyointestinalis subsp. hyointestinalis]CUU74807.1 cysteine synthase A [Campylobacter hyointestinalis subsp. hyointestinalis]CUU75753.1 cysteine synthase A [Campylobacter hyointestinalis subsp. hyointestinalis]CUU77626.1 cysteine synthase A [Campylobacter hyointestinalis subsp. hyointestinalis]